MSNTKSNHFDVVGSLLRPAELKAARAEFEKGNISSEELREVEDRLIAEVIKKQKASRKKYKPYILKYKALVSKYMPYIFGHFKYLINNNLQRHQKAVNFLNNSALQKFEYVYEIPHEPCDT